MAVSFEFYVYVALASLALKTAMFWWATLREKSSALLEVRCGFEHPCHCRHLK